MAIATGMKDIVDEILCSRDERARKIDEMRAEAKAARARTDQMMTDFRKSRAVEASHLCRGLARERAARSSQVRETLNDFRDSRSEEGNELRQQLAKGSVARRSEIGRMRRGAQRATAGFRADRQQMARELRARLTQRQRDLMTQTALLLSSARRMAEDFASCRHVAARRLRKALEQGQAARQTAVREMQRHFGRARQEVSADLAAAAATWRGITRASGTTGSSIRKPSLAARMVSEVREHPEGLALSDVARRLGVATIVLGKVSHSLVNSGQVRKEGRLYLPIAGR